MTSKCHNNNNTTSQQIIILFALERYPYLEDITILWTIKSYKMYNLFLKCTKCNSPTICTMYSISGLTYYNKYYISRNAIELHLHVRMCRVPILLTVYTAHVCAGAGDSSMVHTCGPRLLLSRRPGAPILIAPVLRRSFIYCSHR